MRIIIIGSGLIGVTAAYFLTRRGHDVTVLDREEGPGRQASFANGGLLTPSMAEPWNSPGCWRLLLASLHRSDAALQLHLRTLPTLMGWGIRFLRNSSPAAFERNRLSNLRLALYSLNVMRSVHQRTEIEYGRAARGSLKLFRDATALQLACTAAKQATCDGLSFRALTSAETIALEPALSPIANELAGAIHYDIDETGDAYRFCVALAERARRDGVEFRFRTEVLSLNIRARRVVGVTCEGERLVADRYVVAAGCYSTPLLRRAGVQLPVCPAKGYSITIHGCQSQVSLSIPVIDDHLHAVVVPLGGDLRVAGTAEFAGYALTLSQPRIRNLLMLVQKVLPQLQINAAEIAPWSGLRPMSADGVPIIGSTGVSNLFVSTGHGHLGWTMAAGSAQLLTDLLCGDVPAVDAAAYALSRFSASR